MSRRRRGRGGLRGGRALHRFATALLAAAVGGALGYVFGERALVNLPPERRDTLARVPALREVLSQLANALSTDEMRRLNYEVDGNRRNPKEVVREWIGGKR